MSDNRPQSDAEVDWTRFHSQDESWRTRLLGDLSTAFAIPRYVDLFFETFGEDRALTFLEVGAGNGEVPRRVLDRDPECVSRYTTSEIFPEGARWLRSVGLPSLSSDALHLPFRDRSFDAVISYDVLHHVSDPFLMAREMARVSRGRLFLTESNGLSVGRKLMEQTEGHRATGERSYTPRQYRRFFAKAGPLRDFRIRPFLFPLPGGTPKPLLQPLILFNHIIERVPFFRWQCSNVVMTVEFES
ncbi:MAG: methyltransferase domain-containing protein [Candidatus Latescibacterota bacterium]|nr:methyltransferase domain-containing protein [Candidatus Latescibacterota bacterium]